MDDGRKLKRTRAFFNLWATAYDYFPLILWLHSVQKKVLRIMDPPWKAAILDIGTGTGSAIHMLIQRGHRGKLAGVDLSPRMLERARRKLGKRAELHLADVTKLPFKAGSFDIVMSTEAFHHFTRPEKATREMARVLKKGGRLYVADVNFFFRPKAWLFEKVEPGCVHIYTGDEMRRLFEKAGLAVTTQRRLGLLAILTIGKKR